MSNNQKRLGWNPSLHHVVCKIFSLFVVVVVFCFIPLACLLVCHLKFIHACIFMVNHFFFSPVFNAIIQLCLRHVYPVLFHYIGGMQYKQGKRFVKQCQKWRQIKCIYSSSQWLTFGHDQFCKPALLNKL